MDLEDKYHSLSWFYFTAVSFWNPTSNWYYTPWNLKTKQLPHPSIGAHDWQTLGNEYLRKKTIFRIIVEIAPTEIVRVLIIKNITHVVLTTLDDTNRVWKHEPRPTFSLLQNTSFYSTKEISTLGRFEIIVDQLLSKNDSEFYIKEFVYSKDEVLNRTTPYNTFQVIVASYKDGQDDPTASRFQFYANTYFIP